MNAHAGQRLSVPPDSIGAFSACWYTEQLDSLKEPDLGSLRATADTVVRFLWLRTFHQPVAVRVSAARGRWTAILSVSSGQGGYNPGHLVRRDTLPLSAAAVDTLRALLAAADFWRAPTSERDLGGADGSQWVFEFMTDRQYGLRDRWTPRPPNAFHALGMWFIGMLHDSELTHYLY